MIDLHIHSTCSDGTFTPKQIVQKVIEKGLAVNPRDRYANIPQLEAALDRRK